MSEMLETKNLVQLLMGYFLVPCFVDVPKTISQNEASGNEVYVNNWSPILLRGHL